MEQHPENPIPQAPTDQERLSQTEQLSEIKHTSHTYEDDLAQALDATDASMVQELIQDGREREAIQKENTKLERQKKWYKTGIRFFLFVAFIALGYGIYHYITLTVRAEPTASVGVFQTSNTVVATSTSAQALFETLQADTTLSVGKPTLISLVGNDITQTLLTNSELIAFFGGRADEPFLNAFDIMRYGVLRTSSTTLPFVIASIKDSDAAAKELLINEPKLLSFFYTGVGIDEKTHAESIGKPYLSEYQYNIPMRSLRLGIVGSSDDTTSLVFFYARLTDSTILFAQSTEVLKSVYDTLMQQ